MLTDNASLVRSRSPVPFIMESDHWWFFTAEKSEEEAQYQALRHCCYLCLLCVMEVEGLNLLLLIFSLPNPFLHLMCMQAPFHDLKDTNFSIFWKHIEDQNLENFSDGQNSDSMWLE